MLESKTLKFITKSMLRHKAVSHRRESLDRTQKERGQRKNLDLHVVNTVETRFECAKCKVFRNAVSMMTYSFKMCMFTRNVPKTCK